MDRPVAFMLPLRFAHGVRPGLRRPNAERCESGRIGTTGNRVNRKVPRVRIPPSPPHASRLARRPNQNEICARGRNRIAERCRSGRTGRSRKPLTTRVVPGFESLPLRQIRDRPVPRGGRPVALMSARAHGGARQERFRARRCATGTGEVPEWSNGAVLKTADPSGSQGSNPCLSASSKARPTRCRAFVRPGQFDLRWITIAPSPPSDGGATWKSRTRLP